MATHDDNGHPNSDFPDLEMHTVEVLCSLTRATNDNFVLADNGATHTIVNEDWAIWVDDSIPFETPGRVLGSTPGQYGTVVGEGYMNVLGIRSMSMLRTLLLQYFQ